MIVPVLIQQRERFGKIVRIQTTIITVNMCKYLGCNAEIKAMTTSSNGSIVRVTCLLCGEFTKANDAELWCFSWSAPWINGWVNNREAGDLGIHCAHNGVIVMFYGKLDVIDGYRIAEIKRRRNNCGSVTNYNYVRLFLCTATVIYTYMTHVCFFTFMLLWRSDWESKTST